MLKVSYLVAAMAAIVMCSGCESGSSSSSGGADGDAIDIGSISWLGSDFSGASKSATLNSSSISGDTLLVSYEPYDWPSVTVEVRVNAICCLFYERGGQIVGGKFDWWRPGGQGAKGLENVKHRYNGHSMPASGTPTYTMIASVDGSQRSNIVRVQH